MDDLSQQIEQAIWAGDMEKLHELAPCSCCCDEHYRLDCPAHAYYGCRGSFAIDRPEREKAAAAILLHDLLYRR